MSLNYNEEPVEYCLNCNSLHIVEYQILSSSVLICKKCGCADFTATTTIEKWLETNKNQN